MTQETNMLDNEIPVFIVGAKRGGTTLLRRVVDAHPLISIPPPSWLFHFIYPYLYSYGDLSKPDNFLELIEDCLAIPMIQNHWNIGLTAVEIAERVSEKSFRGLFYTLSVLYSELNGSAGTIWGSKSPGEVFWTREIKRDFPGARFIFLFRDGRDVAADLATTIWGPQSLYSAAMNWRRHMEAILAARENLPADSYIDMRYEDLVRDPESELRKLCAFLGLDYSPLMLEYHQNPTDGFVTSSYHAKTNNPITDEYVGIYRELPQDDRQAIEFAIGDLMQTAGYECNGDARDVGFWESLRMAEADDHGGMMLRGGVELMDSLQKRRNKAFSADRWAVEDRREFLKRTE